MVSGCSAQNCLTSFTTNARYPPPPAPGIFHAIAAQKSVEYGYEGYIYGFAANKELLKHYLEVFNGEFIGMLHPYQFAIDEVNAKKIMEVYDYEYTDEEI